MKPRELVIVALQHIVLKRLNQTPCRSCRIADLLDICNGTWDLGAGANPELAQNGSDSDARLQHSEALTDANAGTGGLFRVEAVPVVPFVVLDCVPSGLSCPSQSPDSP